MARIQNVIILYIIFAYLHDKSVAGMKYTQTEAHSDTVKIYNHSMLPRADFLNEYFPPLPPNVFRINAAWQRTEQQVFLESRQVKWGGKKTKKKM